MAALYEAAMLHDEDRVDVTELATSTVVNSYPMSYWSRGKARSVLLIHGWTNYIDDVSGLPSTWTAIDTLLVQLQ